MDSMASVMRRMPVVGREEECVVMPVLRGGASSASSRQFLLEREEASPGITLAMAEALTEIVDGEVVGPDSGLKLAPGERHRNGRTVPGAGRIGGDRRGAAPVAQIVDEDLALAPGFGHHRQISR